MQLNHYFKHCPHCGRDSLQEQPAYCFVCSACAFQFFLNTATAVGGIILDQEKRILLIRRAKDPAKGKFGLPGGFVDARETIEAALIREVREEVNLEIAAFQYLCSFPNQYHYKGMTYPVIDLFFICQVHSLELIQALDEVDSYCFLKPSEINLDEVAFPSVQQALQRYISQL